MKRLILTFWACLLLGQVAVLANTPGDSIGVKVIQGKAYVLYKVAPGDNLLMISRDYAVSVERLQALNDLEDEVIVVGQVLYVPARETGARGVSLSDYGGDSPSRLMRGEKEDKLAEAPEAASRQARPADANGGRKHTVSKGETLYGISRRYEVTIDQIKTWNGLRDDAIAIGQVLYVSEPAAGTASVDATEEEQPAPVEKVKADAPANTEKPVEKRSGVHVVSAGETLFGIAQQYGMDVRDLRKLNDLTSGTITVGQELLVRADPPANPNQGVGLMEMMEEVTEKKPVDTAEAENKGKPEKEAFPELKVLTAPAGTMLPPAARTEIYRDKYSGKIYKRVEEKGTAALIEDFRTDQTKFYAFHQYLPAGAYLRVDHPAKSQSILVEVIGKLSEKDEHAIRLSAKCMEYLMIRQPGAEVVLRYVIPTEK